MTQVLNVLDCMSTVLVSYIPHCPKQGITVRLLDKKLTLGLLNTTLKVWTAWYLHIYMYVQNLSSKY